MAGQELIEIKKEETTDSGWKFEVSVGGEDKSAEYAVTLDEDYWQELTDGKYDAAELVRRSFGFLLSRESKESILRSFDLRVISRYFPEYEKEIRT